MAALAKAPAPPQGVDIEGEVAYDTTVSWQPVPGAARYRVWWRETTAPQWQHARDAGNATSLKLAGINIDDYYFGVSAVSADGWESPVVFPGFAGSFDRSPPAAGSDRSCTRCAQLNGHFRLGLAHSARFRVEFASFCARLIRFPR